MATLDAEICQCIVHMMSSTLPALFLDGFERLIEV